VILGIDMGGTHIDGAAIEKGVLLASVKHQVNRDDYFLSIWQCLEELIYQTGRRDITRIHLSTTICTNAIVEGQVSEVGLVLQTGPGLKWPFERMGDTVVYLSGSVDHRGKVVRDLDMEELRRVRGKPGRCRWSANSRREILYSSSVSGIILKIPMMTLRWGTRCREN